jgi:hypothetical protein
MKKNNNNNKTETTNELGHKKCCVSSGEIKSKQESNPHASTIPLMLLQTQQDAGTSIVLQHSAALSSSLPPTITE